MRWPELLRASLLPLAVAAYPAAAPPLAQEAQPNLHTQGPTSAPIVESDEAMKVTSVIQCWCGGCVNQTLHECTCGLAATERDRVAAALAAGQTPDALIASYIQEHGPQVRIVPEKRGLALIGWAVPFGAALAGLAALLLVLKAWQKKGLAEAAALASPGAALAADGAYRARLEKELRELD